uniref:Glutaredoxin and cysteine rich domain containing 2 n=1 Tax=Malurus cyaneus samueli TaxID=2593467 RepID=A0A8C5U8B2_9PASS
MDDEPQKKLSQWHDGRPRKVRFKISSSYSGRVLKQVFEDGQELEPPAKEHSRRSVRHSFEPEDPLCGPGELSASRFCWPTLLTAQRISIVREDHSQGLMGSLPLLSDCQPGSIVDFGKIIIYTNNLKIIRAPMDQKELMRRMIQTEGINDWTFMYRERKERFEFPSFRNVVDFDTSQALTDVFLLCQLQEDDADHGCSQCKGSGCAPCSLCHGSKFSMLADRFRESYRALRCPACNESGLQPCPICDA